MLDIKKVEELLSREDYIRPFGEYVAYILSDTIAEIINQYYIDEIKELGPLFDLIELHEFIARKILLSIIREKGDVSVDSFIERLREIRDDPKGRAVLSYLISQYIHRLDNTSEKYY
ncbi:MAG: hypothetical protein GXO26_07535 [Crenarchaeota archaeon]|nr:hypothetical protein [Thermoproteota archaeon]